MGNLLTKEMLINDFDIENVTTDGKVYRHGKQCKTKLLTRKTKYGDYHYYAGVGFKINNKVINLSLGRLMCAWFYGKVDEGMDADHIDGNSLHNDISNLQIITHKQNMQKRTKSHKRIYYEWTKVRSILVKSGVMKMEGRKGVKVCTN